jgi:hypothetical protein
MIEEIEDGPVQCCGNDTSMIFLFVSPTFDRAKLATLLQVQCHLIAVVCHAKLLRHVTRF